MILHQLLVRDFRRTHTPVKRENRMANEFAGLVPKPGDSTDVVKTVDTTPAPPKLDTPKPPVNWDKMSYQQARAIRKGK